MLSRTTSQSSTTDTDGGRAGWSIRRTAARGAHPLRVLARGRQVDRGQPGGPPVAEAGQRDPARNGDARAGQDLQQPGGLLVVAGHHGCRQLVPAEQDPCGRGAGLLGVVGSGTDATSASNPADFTPAVRRTGRDLPRLA